jgi:hypothetical protein
VYAGVRHTPLDEAIRIARTPTGIAPSQGLGWVMQHDGDEIWHNGATGGFYSTMFVDVKGHRAVVVLANSRNSVDDLGLHILHPEQPLAAFEAPFELDPKAFDAYAGRYEFGPQFYIDFMRVGDRYYTRGKGQPIVELIPHSATSFALVDVEVTVDFVRGEGDAPMEAVVHQGGAEHRGKKAGPVPAP